MLAAILRDKFLEYFKTKKHRIIESASLVPQDDPTVLFTPAGMNQFKKQFLGIKCAFRRAATCQRCLRTDDLEKVGKTTSHHTFFEMLGNFSFGDYFKEEAIFYAWEFLTQILKINSDQLWVSVYKEDTEAHRIWKEKIKIPAQRIIKLGDKENFWPSEVQKNGPNGPCGPCSEIFYDWGKDTGCGLPDCSPNCGCGRFVEVWNLVFTQFNRQEGGNLELLPQKNIDTGMGLERLAAVMQGVHSNFETDLFIPLVKEITNYPAKLFQSRRDAAGVIKMIQRDQLPITNYQLIYAVCDHARAVTFAVYDGVLPSNEAAGYVVRKLIRKSTLHLRTLGLKQPFLYRLVPLVCAVMKSYYPELGQRKENIAQIILAEEKNFLSSLDNSENLFREKFSLLPKNDSREAGRITFQLYDTYGIPFELTQSWLASQGLEVSQDAFQEELDKQKNRSKSQSRMQGAVFAHQGVDLGIKETKFLGYKETEMRAKILKIFKEEKETKRITQDESAKIILDRSVFYAESGGQIGDSGSLSKGKNIFDVQDTQRTDRVILHLGTVKRGVFKKGDFILAKIDTHRRMAIARSHTATHLLQAALRKVLGFHVRQQGSWVEPDRLRFDFTHFQDLTKEELRRIEELVNIFILQNHPLLARVMPKATAKKKGALAFFAEKYASLVRVVSISDISLELCGGTHLGATGQISLFKIIQEGSIASGVRRIEALTGLAAYKKIKEEEEVLAGISEECKVPAQNLVAELQKRLTRLKVLEKIVHLQKMAGSQKLAEDLLKNSERIGDLTLIAQTIAGLDISVLRNTVDILKTKTASGVIALGSESGKKALLVVGLTQDLVQKGLDARDLIQPAALILGGSGGGRPDFAQAGGSQPQNFNQAFSALKRIIQEKSR